MHPVSLWWRPTKLTRLARETFFLEIEISFWKMKYYWIMFLFSDFTQRVGRKKSETVRMVLRTIFLFLFLSFEFNEHQSLGKRTFWSIIDIYHRSSRNMIFNINLYIKYSCQISNIFINDISRRSWENHWERSNSLCSQIPNILDKYQISSSTNQHSGKYTC